MILGNNLNDVLISKNGLDILLFNKKSTKNKTKSISAPFGAIISLILIDSIRIRLMMALKGAEIDSVLFLVDFLLNKRIPTLEKMTKNHQFYFQSATGGSDSPIIAKPQSYFSKLLTMNREEKTL